MPHTVVPTAIRHLLSPNFASAAATNCVIAGPSPDGFVHLYFHRDVLHISQESLAPLAGAAGEQSFTATITPGDTESIREGVARISMPTGAFLEFVSLLQKHADQVRAVKGAEN